MDPPRLIRMPGHIKVRWSEPLGADAASVYQLEKRWLSSAEGWSCLGRVGLSRGPNGRVSLDDDEKELKIGAYSPGAQVSICRGSAS
jgi:hypothetical protein